MTRVLELRKKLWKFLEGMVVKMIESNNPYETNSTDPKDILCDAAKYLEEHGWRKNGNGGYGAPACAAGAIATVTLGFTERYYSAMELLAGRLRDMGKESTVTWWNDRAETTQDEVIATLKGDNC